MEQNCRDNRELSWLKFNARVLEEAEDLSNPLCERLSFASIYQSNLDEFFGVRVGFLHDQMEISKDIRDKNTEMTSQEQIDAVFSQVRLLGHRKDLCYRTLDQDLRDQGIEIVGYSEISQVEEAYLDSYFEKEVRPLLVPQVVGRKQPFPFLKDKAIYAVVLLGPKKASKANKADKLGIVPCSIDVLPRLVRIPDQPNRYILMENLILHCLARVFSHFEIKSRSLIRVIRNADIDPDEDMYSDDIDFRQVMEQLVNRRRRLAPIKLEYTGLMDEAVVNVLCKYLKLKKSYIFYSEAPLDLSFYEDVSDLLWNRKELFYPKYTPRYPADIDPRESLIEQVEERDRLLFYPFESMDPFLQLLNEAAEDPDVISIKMTLYRVAKHSKVIDTLIRAAESGKEVTVMVELRARFDEANNIGWSRRLEEAGCSILYGLDDLKVHSKVCLITRKEGDGIRYITQVGTGNYNEKTAGLYTDLSLMTANFEIGNEVAGIFTHMYLDEVEDETNCLMVAPQCLRDKILDRIDEQIALAKEGSPAYVGGKMNALTDRVIIDRLIEASRAGVKVELVIRSACCLIAGVPGATENIKVRSIVGRFLEHSRIYIFGAEDPEVFISSADFMTRNTTRRVEVAAPILDPELKAQVLEIFRIQMEDNVKARIQQPDGTYVRAVPAEGEEALSSQEFFMHPAQRAQTE